MGLDASESMILTAKISSPASLETAGGKVEYQVHDCRRLPTTIQNYETGFQKIFSNAALHWILAGDTDRRQFFVDAFEKLQPGGVFVAEAGGWGNVEAVRVALAMALARRGLLAVEPWWFGSEDEYRELLQSAGFEVEVMEMEYRPTKVDGGVHQWVEMFCSTILAVVEDDGERAAVVKEAVDAVESVVKRSDGVWVAYVRVRFVARKPKD
jgi:trans-aconitate methyltransferase